MDHGEEEISHLSAAIHHGQPIPNTNDDKEVTLLPAETS
jgi:hypothetical protein